MPEFVRAEVCLYRPAVNAQDGSYRPHLRVGPDGAYLGVCFVDGPARLEPNVCAEVTLALMYTGVNYAPLEIGTEFEVVEGRNVAGRGTVQRHGRAESVELFAQDQ